MNRDVDHKLKDYFEKHRDLGMTVKPPWIPTRSGRRYRLALAVALKSLKVELSGNDLNKVVLLGEHQRISASVALELAEIPLRALQQEIRNTATDTPPRKELVRAFNAQRLAVADVFASPPFRKPRLDAGPVRPTNAKDPLEVWLDAAGRFFELGGRIEPQGSLSPTEFWRRPEIQTGEAADALLLWVSESRGLVATPFVGKPHLTEPFTRLSPVDTHWRKGNEITPADFAVPPPTLSLVR